MRSENDLLRGDYDNHCPICGKVVNPIATPENAPTRPLSIYGITKLYQELATRTTCAAYGIPAVALRFQNVYGPGQSLSNPYTGVLSIWASRALNDNAIEVYEDGLESRDFVFIDDVVRSIYLALNAEGGEGRAINIGSGIPTTLLDVANMLLEALRRQVPIQISGRFRKGDIRHNFADLALARKLLGFQPQIDLRYGLSQFAEWVLSRPTPPDNYARTILELEERGLT